MQKNLYIVEFQATLNKNMNFHEIAPKVIHVFICLPWSQYSAADYPRRLYVDHTICLEMAMSDEFCNNGALHTGTETGFTVPAWAPHNTQTMWIGLLDWISVTQHSIQLWFGYRQCGGKVVFWCGSRVTYGEPQYAS